VPKQASHKMMRSFKLSSEVIDALDRLTEAVNQKINIKVSRTQILELLILDAAKSNGDKVTKLIQSK